MSAPVPRPNKNNTQKLVQGGFKNFPPGLQLILFSQKRPTQQPPPLVRRVSVLTTVLVGFLKFVYRYTSNASSDHRRNENVFNNRRACLTGKKIVTLRVEQKPFTGSHKLQTA